jgi:hypothetical protein
VRALTREDATDLDRLLFRQQGVLTRRQAITHLGRGAVQNRLAQGRW